MNILSNIWDHPKTSAAGLLIAVVRLRVFFRSRAFRWAARAMALW